MAKICFDKRSRLNCVNVIKVNDTVYANVTVDTEISCNPGDTVSFYNKLWYWGVVDSEGFRSLGGIKEVCSFVVPDNAKGKDVLYIGSMERTSLLYTDEAKSWLKEVVPA